MAFENQQSQRQERAPQLAEIAVRAAGQMFDMQLSTLRTLAQSQARAGAMFGLPDYSDLLERGTEPLRQALQTSTEQWLDTTRRASDALDEVQRQFGRIVGTQANQAAQTLQQSVEQLSQQTTRSLEQWRETAREQADQAERSGEVVGNATRSNLQQSGEQWRRQILEAGEQTREASRDAGEAVRRQAEGTAKNPAKPEEQQQGQKARH